MSEAKLRIQASQGLRFINRLYYESTPIRYDTRLHNDFTFLDKVDKSYCQPIEQTDSLWFQLRTSYTNFTVNLVNATTYAKTVLVPDDIWTYEDDDSDTMTVYNVPVTITSITGVYYVEVLGLTTGLPIVKFWSEHFNVQSEHENTLSIKWGGNSSIADGMRWSNVSYAVDIYQYLRIQCRIIDISYGTDKSTYNDSNSELTTLNAYPNCTHVLEIKEIPYYLIERISLALQHDEFYVNGVLYNIDEDFEMTNFKWQTMTTGQIALRVVEYENYSSDEILTGTTATGVIATPEVLNYVADGATPAAQNSIITSPTTWTATKTDSWITLDVASGGTGDPCTVSVSSLASGERQGSVVINDDGGLTNASIIINQGGNISANPDTFYSLTGGDRFPAPYNSVISCNTTWTAVSNDSWIILDNTTGSPEGNLTIRVSVSKIDRTGTITVKNDNDPDNIQATITVNQVESIP